MKEINNFLGNVELGELSTGWFLMHTQSDDEIKLYITCKLGNEKQLLNSLPNWVNKLGKWRIAVEGIYVILKI